MDLSLLNYTNSSLIIRQQDQFIKYQPIFNTSTQEIIAKAYDETIRIDCRHIQLQPVVHPLYHLIAKSETAKFISDTIDQKFPVEHIICIVNLKFDQEPDEKHFKILETVFVGQNVLFVQCPFQNILQSILYSQNYKIFNSNILAKLILHEQLNDQFISDHSSKIDNFFKSDIHVKFKLQLFKQVTKHEQFYIYDFLKPFRLVTIQNPQTFRDFVLWITCLSPFKKQTFDKEELKQKVISTLHNYETWMVEQTELRGMLGIISSYLHLNPWDRLNGDFDNDRIVLYTYLVMDSNVKLFEELCVNRGYIMHSIMNDLPGFGMYFKTHLKKIPFEDIKMKLSLRMRKLIDPNENEEKQDVKEMLQKLKLEFKFPYVESMFKLLVKWTMNFQMQNLRAMTKMIDTLLHSYEIERIIGVVYIIIAEMLNYIFDYFVEQKQILIKDVLRISGVILGMFKEFVNLNDTNMTQILSLFVFAVYKLAQERIKVKTQFSIKDKTLPLEFEGDQACFVYVHDKYDWRTRYNFHILAEPGEFHVFSASQLKDIKTYNSTTSDLTTQNFSNPQTPKRRISLIKSKKEDQTCSFCVESLARLVRTILLTKSEDASYYFDNSIIKRPCVFCSGKTYAFKDETEIIKIIKCEPIQTILPEFSDDKPYRNYITNYFDIDNTIEKLQNVYNVNLDVKKMSDDIITHQETVKRLLNVDGQIIQQLNDVQDIGKYLKQDVDTLDFKQLEDMIKYNVDVQEAQQYDAFMTTQTPKPNTKKTTMTKGNSVENFKRMQQLAMSVVNRKGENCLLKDISDETIGDIRVYVTKTISIESALISVLRSWLTSPYGIKSILQGTCPQQPQDAYSLFYKNEQMLGRSIGLPSMLSIFKNSDQEIGSHDCEYIPQINELLNIQNQCKKQFNYYITTLDPSTLKKNQAKFSNQLISQMLMHTLQQYSIEQMQKLHLTDFYKQTVCVLLQAIKFIDKSTTQKWIKEQIQIAINDGSNYAFSTNWFIDSFKQKRNNKLQQKIGLKLDKRVPGWPEQFELDLKMENYTSNGLGYIPAFLRYLNKFRTYIFNDEDTTLQKCVLYQFEQLECNSKVIVVQRHEAVGASLQSATVEALVNDPPLLKKFILNQDQQGNLTVKHLSIDTIQILLNNGELGLLCEWMCLVFDELMKYINAKPIELGYKNTIQQLIEPSSKFVQKQYYLQQKLQEYFTNNLVQMIICLNSLFGALSESNSIMIAPIMMRVASLKKNITGDPLMCQLQARAIIQLKILLGMQLKVRTGTMLETIQFNSRKLIPLVTKIQYVKQIFLQSNVHLLITTRQIVSQIQMSPISVIGYEKQPTKVDLVKALLNHRGIFVPLVVNGQMYDGTHSGPCAIIIDAESMEQKQRKLTIIIADHQIYVYEGNKLENYVGSISLVGSVVCMIEDQKEKSIGITTKFPRLRSYLIKSYKNDDIDELYISIVGAII